MKAKRTYINPKVIEGTMRVLEAYKSKHGGETPMASCANSQGVKKDEHARFIRAAQRLGWDVTRSQGKIYENGVLVWEA